MLQDDIERVLLEKGLLEGILEGVVAEDGEAFVHFGHEDVFLEDCDELLPDHIGEILAESVHAFGADHHVFLLHIPGYFLAESARLVDDLFTRELDQIEGFVNIEQLYLLQVRRVVLVLVLDHLLEVLHDLGKGLVRIMRIIGNSWRVICLC